MEKFLEKLFDINKIPTKLFFVIFLSTGLILFVPNKFLTKLNLTDFLNDYGKFIGISFIISSSFLLITLINYFSKKVKNKKFKRKIEESILRDIQYLDHHEKALIREFFINGKYTLQLPIDNDTVVSLVNKRIIYQASSTGFTYIHGAYFPYSITEIARNNLTEEMIDLPKNPTEDDKIRIMNDRPSWAKDKSRFDDLLNSRW